MYIEMVDETGQVSEEIIKQTHDILEFAAKKIGKEEKEMATKLIKKMSENIEEYWHEYKNQG